MNVVVRDAPVLTIDGSAGEGGGQILRTSLALSMLLGRPFVLERIRGQRKKPGLMRQHLTCVRAAAQICGAEVEGAELGSARLRFAPGRIQGGAFDFDVGSAGSTALVLQTIALPLLSHACEVTIRGGTHALWAPTYEFLERAWLPRLWGAHMVLELKRVGFYPAGGGELVMRCQPSQLQPLHVPVRSGALEVTRGSVGAGNAIWIDAHDRETGIRNVFSAIAERGVSATDLAASCETAFSSWRDSGTSVEEHLADQLMLPMLVAGAGSYTCAELTLHSRTNIEVIHAFTGQRLQVHRLEPRGYRVAL